MQEIQLNIIPFSPTVTKLEVGLFKEKTEGYASLHKGEYPKELWEQYESELKEISHLYCNFSTTENADYTATVDINKNTNFGLHYFRFLIYNYLQDKVDVLFPNFVNDVEVWQHDKNRIEYFNQLGYQSLTIWNKEWIDDPLEVIERCKNFLKK
jgi:hypothetical protein